MHRVLFSFAFGATALACACSAQVVGTGGSIVYTPTDTSHVSVLWRQLPGAVWKDELGIAAGPFHMNRRNAAWWLGLAAVTAALMETDHTTSQWLPNTADQIRVGNDVSKLGASYTLGGVAASAYLLGLASGNAHLRETGLLGGEALLDSLILVEGLKFGVGRIRPNVAGGEAGSFFDAGASFPSGHSTASWALASVVAHEYRGKKVAFLAYGLATLVSAARVTARQHFPSDVVAGGAIGWFIGQSVYRQHTFMGWGDHPLRAKLQPVVDPRTRTFGAGLRLQWVSGSDLSGL